MDVGGQSGEMRVFAQIATDGSLSGAARALGLTPSAVSRIVARIEQRLGTRLLVRTTRTLQLTTEGQTYLRAAHRILADIAEVEESIAVQGVPRGRLRVTASLAHGRIAIVPMLREFTARYPEIVIDLVLGDQVLDILAGQADVAIRFGILPDSPLTARRLGETGRMIVASPGYLARHGTPQRPEDLHGHNCLNFTFRRSEADWPFHRDGRDFTLDLQGSIAANSGEALSQLARLGVGVARIGTFTVLEDIANGSLVPLLEAFNPQDREAFHAVFVGGATMPARVRVFVDFLVEKFSASATPGELSRSTPGAAQ